MAIGVPIEGRNLEAINLEYPDAEVHRQGKPDTNMPGAGTATAHFQRSHPSPSTTARWPVRQALPPGHVR